ncbi:D-alanyl-D-alanine carboxypeptidase [Halomonas sp. CH40]
MLAVLILLILSVSSGVQANPRYAGIVVDLDNGEVLYAENADERRYPASLVKMMTLYMTFEALESGRLSLHQPLPVSAYAAAKPAVKLWLPAGSTITVDQAIRALAVRSANDVAAVLAEALGGSEGMFALQMTERARELGMTATTFKNASGLPDSGQVTTARDMVRLAVEVMDDFPQYYHYFALQSFSFNGKTHKSHNRLVRNYPGADGLKTGFIRASGFNVATTATRGNRRLVGIVMGGFTSKSRDAHMADLLDRSFLRSSLRDQGNWLANADFSREYMRFDTPPPRYSQPAYASISNAYASNRYASNSASPVREVREVAVRAATRPATAAPAGHGGWGVQLGAFAEEGLARRLATQASQQLGTQSGQVAVQAVPGQSQLFRARLVSLEEQQARRACLQLRSQGMDCMVVNASL